jgi:hypothetical protein
MPQYLIAVYDEPGTRSRPAEVSEPIYAAVDVVNQKAIADGIFVFAGGLHEPSATTTLIAHDGKPELTDGPFLESKEYLGGFWIIEVPDLDAALAFAREAAVACQAPLEVRPFMEQPPAAA